MDEQPIAASTAAASTASQPETLAELAQTPLPTTAASSAKAGAKASTSAKKPTPQHLVSQAGAQVDALRQAETIRQLQNQVKLLEGQSREAGKVFLATVTSLVSSAFALVAALAWNDAIQSLFKAAFIGGDENPWSLFFPSLGYALLVTIIVVVVIWYLTKLNKQLGGQSLINEVPRSEGGKKEKD